MIPARLKRWPKPLFASGAGMIMASLLLTMLVFVRFRYEPIEGHVLELMMWAFGVGYALYAGAALPLFGRALARAGETS